jgi:Flp pilus assembly CpaF family ATPase
MPADTNSVHHRQQESLYHALTDLLRMTLRLRPDRIIIGEVRGPEVLAMLDLSP